MPEMFAPPSDRSTRPLPEALARMLRHEVGDFLQKVYASVAILQTRLPPEASLERDLLGRLRQRAEGCKHLIDAVQDFLCPLTLSRRPIDLAGVAAGLVAAARPHHPGLTIEAEGTAGVAAADPERVSLVGKSLLENACQAAQSRVNFHTEPEPSAGQVRWTIRDDGPGVPPDLVHRLFAPFFTTRAGHAGLGLALAKKIVELHGGTITAANAPDGGFEVTILLPAGRAVPGDRAAPSGTN